MYLKRLEIQGFKSFADKLTIEFSDLLTMIVGPNGSGKSNILDAIRWVLGEQSSKSLRGQSMSDVIFMGTETRAPVSFASVTLVLDNEKRIFDIDSSEIFISRKYFRSGDSKYFLNKKECRLLDVQNVLMNTGLAKDGYSIIGQGKIDEILSLKSKDRRDFFDEATGITRFRYKKDEAEKKLQGTLENLSRLEDILHEKHSKLEPLEKQSYKAKEYLKLIEILKNNEVNLRKIEISDIEQEQKSLNEKYTICKNDIYNNKLEQNKNKFSIEKLSNEIGKLNSLLEDISKKESEKLNVYIENKSKFDVLASEISFKLSGKDRITQENENLKLSIEELNFKNKAFDLSEDNANINTKLQQIDTILNDNSLILAEILKITEQIKELNLYEENQNIQKHTLNLKSIENDIKFTKNLLDNLDFLPKSIGFVVNNKNLDGIIGTVSSIISVEENFSLAINTALGGFSNNIIVKTAENAISAIDLLKKERVGFATFLPLDKIYSKKSDFSRFKNRPGVVGHACDIIKFEKMYENVIFRALGDTLIVDNSKTALEISRTENLKIVTIDGETFHKGGAISGGRANKNLGIFEHKNKLKNLENAKLSEQNILLNCDKAMTDLLEKETLLNRQKIELNEKISANNSYVLKLESEIQISKHILQSKEAEFANFIEKIDLNRKQIEYNLLKISEIDSDILKMELEKATTLENIEDFENEKNANNNEKFEINAKKDVLNAEIILLSSKSSDITEQRIDLEKEFINLENHIERAEERKHDILTKLIDKYDVPYSEMMCFSTELSKNELKNIVSDLNLQIKGLGNINLDSIDEYITIKDEYEELFVQVDDIKKSKLEVDKLIFTIETEMKDVFIKEFNKINSTFEDVFCHLFGGGYGILELSDPEDVLNSGIEIYVCPPGKKEKSLSLLSGGERAFVAIAILFSIVTCKPTPFCVLDEIDSALDDINVTKYAEYLKNNCINTQFIVITHRKGTMQSADILYGVTMENKGVSKLLKMKL